MIEDLETVSIGRQIVGFRIRRCVTQRGTGAFVTNASQAVLASSSHPRLQTPLPRSSGFQLQKSTRNRIGLCSWFASLRGPHAPDNRRGNTSPSVAGQMGEHGRNKLESEKKGGSN